MLLVYAYIGDMAEPLRPRISSAGGRLIEDHSETLCNAHHRAHTFNRLQLTGPAQSVPFRSAQWKMGELTTCLGRLRSQDQFGLLLHRDWRSKGRILRDPGETQS
jgi:hypothetical protein